MAATYNPTLPTATDQVRFLVQDTNVSRAMFQDEEIAWVVTQEMNVYMVGARLCRTLVGTRSGGVLRKKVGTLDITYDVKFYLNLAASLEARGMNYQTPYAGGISIADKDDVRQNSDWVQPAISKGQGNNPQAPQTSLPPVNPLTR